MPDKAPALFVRIMCGVRSTACDVTFTGGRFLIDDGAGNNADSCTPPDVVNRLLAPLTGTDGPADVVFMGHSGTTVTVCFHAARSGDAWNDLRDPSNSTVRDVDDVAAELAALLLSLMAETAATVNATVAR